MEEKKNIKEVALKTICQEAEAVANVKNSINNDFIHVVEKILISKGRVIVTGIGKSANIGQKIVATLNSTGTPSIFMHAADAIHGDLGIIRDEDIVLCISKSGETPEIKVLIPLIKMRENMLVAMVGNSSSYLAIQSDYILDVTVDKEACPNNLAPTTSTTVQLVMGDALAMALLQSRGFTAQDFAKFHPGGALGKKMYLKVSDIYARNEVPEVAMKDNIRTVIIEISSKRLGATAVLENRELKGFITDGDLRRMMESEKSVAHLTAEEIMTVNPKSVDEDTLVIDALQLMRKNSITQMPVLKDGKYAGIIHLHDILKEGIL
ncbi:MAG: SIS domain-containing protein [Bacteroidales bacterium]